MRSAHPSASLANETSTGEDSEGERHVKPLLLSLITWTGCSGVARGEEGEGDVPDLVGVLDPVCAERGEEEPSWVGRVIGRHHGTHG